VSPNRTAIHKDDETQPRSSRPHIISVATRGHLVDVIKNTNSSITVPRIVRMNRCLSFISGLIPATLTNLY